MGRRVPMQDYLSTAEREGLSRALQASKRVQAHRAAKGSARSGEAAAATVEAGMAELRLCSREVCAAVEGQDFTSGELKRIKAAWEAAVDRQHREFHRLAQFATGTPPGLGKTTAEGRLACKAELARAVEAVKRRGRGRRRKVVGSVLLLAVGAGLAEVARWAASVWR